MPCNCDHLEPNQYEIEAKKVAQNIVFTCKKLRKKIPENAQEGVNDCYGNVAELKNMTVFLCSLLRSLSKKDLDRIVYNGRDKDSRKLADWWDEHKKADRVREKKEKES